MTTTQDAARLLATIATVPGVRDALVTIAASYRPDAAALGVAMGPGQRQEALGLLAEDVLLHRPDVVAAWGTWPAAVRGLTLALAALASGVDIVAEPLLVVEPGRID